MIRLLVFVEEKQKPAKEGITNKACGGWRFSFVFISSGANLIPTTASYFCEKGRRKQRANMFTYFCVIRERTRNKKSESIEGDNKNFKVYDARHRMQRRNQDSFFLFLFEYMERSHIHSSYLIQTYKKLLAKHSTQNFLSLFIFSCLLPLVQSPDWNMFDSLLIINIARYHLLDLLFKHPDLH